MGDKEGYFWKEGGHHKSWKKRWFLLVGSTLYYFKSEQDFHGDTIPKSLGNIPLCSCSVTALPNYKKRKFCFSVTTPSRPYFFDALAEGDRDSWMKCITAASSRPDDRSTYNEARVLLLGVESCGKTSLTRRWFLNEFRPEYVATTLREFTTKILDLDRGLRFKLDVWEIAGSVLGDGAFLTPAPSSSAAADLSSSSSSVMGGSPSDLMSGCTGALLVFDSTNPGSFAKVKKWARQLRETHSMWTIMLVATKVDLESDRQINAAIVQAFAEELDAAYLETSAKTGKNVVEMFTIVADMLYRAGNSSSVFLEDDEHSRQKMSLKDDDDEEEEESAASAAKEEKEEKPSSAAGGGVFSGSTSTGSSGSDRRQSNPLEEGRDSSSLDTPTTPSAAGRE